MKVFDQKTKRFPYLLRFFEYFHENFQILQDLSNLILFIIRFIPIHIFHKSGYIYFLFFYMFFMLIFSFNENMRIIAYTYVILVITLPSFILRFQNANC